MKECFECGLKYNESTKFCSECGTKLFIGEPVRIEWLTPTSFD